MARVKHLDWSELHAIGQPKSNSVIVHVKEYWPLYLQAGLTTGSIILAGPSVALAAGSLDAAGNVIYGKLINVGKWVIIIKGGIEIIQNISSGDLQAAKKQFLGYLMIYGTLWALPWGMDTVESTFRSMKG